MIATSTGEVAAAAGVSFRRLDNWATRGYLRPEGDGGGKPGWRRYWPDREIRVAVVMGRLVDAGLTVETAALAARRAVDAWYEGDATSEQPVRVPLYDGGLVIVEVAP